MPPLQQDEAEATQAAAQRAAANAAAQAKLFAQQDAVRGLLSRAALVEVDVARRCQAAAQRAAAATAAAAEAEFLRRRDASLQVPP